MKTQWLTVGIIALCVGSCAFGMTGKTATIVSLRLDPFYGPQPSNRGRLLLVTVENNRVAKTDTILRGNAWFYNAVWSFDGKHIAFYRDSAVSIIDPDGNNPHDIAKVPTWSREDQEQHICWPGTDNGKWLYYHRPCTSQENCFHGGSGEIWKVNVTDTTQRSLVCDYKKLNNTATGWDGLLKFQMSKDAKYCAIHTSTEQSALGYQPGIIPHTFPPQVNPSTGWIDPNLTEPRCVGQNCYYRGDCNSALSASGKILYHLRGSHTAIYAHFWNHADNTIGDFWPIGTGGSGTLDQFKDIESWLTSGKTGGGLVYPMGACNSDQIVVVCTNWNYGADLDCGGNNQIVANWKDKEAVLTTNNPKAQGDGYLHWFADIGDFWLAGGPANCYEDVDGKWIDVTTGQVTSVGNVPAAPHVNGSPGVHGSVTVYDLKGARVGTFDARELTQGMRSGLLHGAYVAKELVRGVAAKIVTAQ